MEEVKTLYGQLYGYSEESVHYDWYVVDGILFRDITANTQLVQNCLHMVEEQFNLPLTNVWRAHVLPSGMVELNDFTMPSSTGKIRDVFKQENLPQWIQDSLSVLMIVDQGSTVEGVGKKISDSIFYLMETPEIGEVYGNKA